MDDDVEVFTLGPARYDKLDFLGVGFHFVSDILDRTSELFTTLTIMTAQGSLQRREDREFGRIVNGS